MTPSTSVAQALIDKGAPMGLVYEQVEDEIAAANMALGASYAGARALVTTSGGGFALMNEGVSLAGVSETPIVFVVAQRPGPATGIGHPHRAGRPGFGRARRARRVSARGTGPGPIRNSVFTSRIGPLTWPSAARRRSFSSRTSPWPIPTGMLEPFDIDDLPAVVRPHDRGRRRVHALRPDRRRRVAAAWCPDSPRSWSGRTPTSTTSRAV